MRATNLEGRVGEAAHELARVLEPHFVREEEIALPPLGLLEPLSKAPPTPAMRGVLRMTDALRAELPKMLQEHAAIAAAARRLETVARDERNAQVEDLAKKLQLHARSRAIAAQLASLPMTKPQPARLQTDAAAAAPCRLVLRELARGHCRNSRRLRRGGAIASNYVEEDAHGDQGRTLPLLDREIRPEAPEAHPSPEAR